MEGLMDAGLISTGMKMLAMLALVLACLILALFIMRRLLRLGAQSQGQVDMKRLGVFHLSPKQRIEVVEICGRRIVLGVTPGAVSYITTLKDFNEISPKP